MKDIILRNRYSLLTTVLAAYVLVVVIEGAVTGREPDWLRFDNSLFTFDLRQLDALDGIDIDFN
ncbi:MAG: hypothetical protein GKR91_20305 [Pseudomonadales bacterium]|nr:hypothetical protein [Pseudomonadales bacterium]